MPVLCPLHQAREHVCKTTQEPQRVRLAAGALCSIALSKSLQEIQSQGCQNLIADMPFCAHQYRLWACAYAFL
jgi:hypothetical protein